MMEENRTTRINVIAVVRESCAVILRHWRACFALVWLPLVVLLAAGTILLVTGMQFTGRLWAAMGFQGAMYLLLVPAVTSWHRLILLGPGSRISYSFGHEEIAYIEVLIGVGVAVYMFMLLSGLMFAAPLISGAAWAIGNSDGEWFYRLLAWMVSFFVVARFLLVVPAAALGGEMKTAVSSAILRRNVLRFTAAYFLALVIPQVLLWFVGDPSSWILRGLSGPTHRLPVFASFYAGLVITVVFWMLSASVLSFVYKSMIPERAGPPLPLAN